MSGPSVPESRQPCLGTEAWQSAMVTDLGASDIRRYPLLRQQPASNSVGRRFSQRAPTSKVSRMASSSDAIRFGRCNTRNARATVAARSTMQIGSVPGRLLCVSILQQP